MGTVFLKLIGEAVAAALARSARRAWLRRAPRSTPDARWLAAAVDRFLAYLRDERAYSPSTIEHYAQALAQLADFAERTRPAPLARADAAQAQALLAERAPRARLRALDAARSGLGLAQLLPLPRARRRGGREPGHRPALAEGPAQAAAGARRRRDGAAGRSARRATPRRCATAPCWNCCTRAACAWPNCAACAGRISMPAKACCA